MSYSRAWFCLPSAWSCALPVQTSSFSWSGVRFKASGAASSLCRSTSSSERSPLRATTPHFSHPFRWRGYSLHWSAPQSPVMSPRSGDGATSSASFRSSLQSRRSPSPTSCARYRLRRVSDPPSSHPCRATPGLSASASCCSSLRAPYPRPSRSSGSSPSAHASPPGHCPASCRAERSCPAAACPRRSLQG